MMSWGYPHGLEPPVFCTSRNVTKCSDDPKVISPEGKADQSHSIEPVESPVELKKPAKRNPRLKLTEELVNGR